MWPVHRNCWVRAGDSVQSAVRSSWEPTPAAQGRCVGLMRCYVVFSGGVQSNAALTVLSSTCWGVVGWDSGEDPQLPRAEIQWHKSPRLWAVRGSESPATTVFPFWGGWGRSPLGLFHRLVSLQSNWWSCFYGSIFSLCFIKVTTLCLLLISNCWVLWWWEQLEQWAGKQDSCFLVVKNG